MSRRIFPVFAALAIALAACAETATEEGTTEETPVVDAASIEQSVRSASDSFGQAMLAADAEALTSMYTSDAVVMAPGMPGVEGTEGVNSMFAAMTSAGAAPSAFTIEPSSVVVSSSGDMAYETGSYSWTGPGPDGAEVTDSGKYAAIWKPVDGTWKMAVDIWNSDGAPAGPEGETETTE